jgi:hypothetical protein
MAAPHAANSTFTRSSNARDARDLHGAGPGIVVLDEVFPRFATLQEQTDAHAIRMLGWGLDAEVVDLVQETVKHDGDHALYGVLSKLFGVYRLHRPLASQLDLDSFRIVDGPKVALGCPR